MISILTVMQFIVNIMIFIVILSIIGLVLVLLFKDKGANQHSVLHYPVLGRVRLQKRLDQNYVNTYLLMIQRGNHFQETSTQICQVNTTLECQFWNTTSIRMDFTYEIQCFFTT